MSRLRARTAVAALALAAGAVALQSTAAYASTDLGWFPDQSSCQSYGQDLVDNGEYDSFTCQLVTDGNEWHLMVD